MKTILLLSSIILAAYCHGQKNLDGLIRAEKDFAEFSLSSGTRAAFIKFLDSTGIVFNQQKQAVNGLHHWESRPDSKGQLYWQPRIAEIALSNDFGYTSGPWTFKASPQDTISASGIYTTVWHFTKGGQWKFLVDLGNSHVPFQGSTTVELIPFGGIGSYPFDSSLVTAEKELIRDCISDPVNAFLTRTSTQSIINQDDLLPASEAGDLRKAISRMGKAPVFIIGGWGLASSGDLGYVYGQSILNGKLDNYLRIWRREPKGWKIALQVIHSQN